MIDTFAICGFNLTPGHFSSRIASVSTPDFRLFCFNESNFYMALDGELYKIPRLSYTDLASIPQPLWSLLPPQGEDGAEYALPAAYHDSAYRNTLQVWNGTDWVKATLSKDKCDLLLKESMLACSVPEHIVETIYEAVNLAGFSAFNANRK